MIQKPEISIREFSDWGSTVSRVLEFLKKHSHKAFTPKGIMKHTKISYKNIQVCLSKLKKQGLVNHKSPYWAYNISLAKQEGIPLSRDPEAIKKKRGKRIDFPLNTEKSIVNSIKSGKKSLTSMAKKYKVDKSVIKRICKEHGVRSKFKFPIQK